MSDILAKDVAANKGWFMECIAAKRAKMAAAAAAAPPSEGVCAMDSGARGITVACRTRPVLGFEQQRGWYSAISCTGRAGKGTVHLHQPSLSFDRKPKIVDTTFQFDHAFGSDCPNTHVYEQVGKPLVSLALRGGVSTVFAYGQTGSGKTYTISSIVDQAAQDLFSLRPEVPQSYEGRRAKDPSLPEDPISLSLQYFEIVGDECQDLMAPGEKVLIREDRFKAVQVTNAKSVPISSPEEFVAMCVQAAGHRRTDATYRNDASSRSHSVCIVTVHNAAYPQSEDGRLHLVDLAGSEGVEDKKHHDKTKMKEAAAINKSLMGLKDCMRARTMASSAVASVRHVHVPYRAHKLTLLLKDSFELASTRQSHTVVLAMVAPNDVDVKHSLNTLRYAAPFKVAVKNARPPPPDPRNPSNWDHDKAAGFITLCSRGRIDPEVVMPGLSGLQMCKMPEQLFLERSMQCKGVSMKFAKEVYVKIWNRVVDCNTKARKEALKPRAKKKTKKPEGDYYQESVKKMQGKGQK
ncbi:kinesin-like protein [Kipferlia bialata]|uniref:Kinesin-like protein n=1 Tax=Kipferlia bialata TaxID=797122 RepID=A0A9K3D135_9EUKA|nr:kinesin-like protein [Kipferlia bialata]|eukprot:g6988.t1